jgi:5-methyltetrahydrofolate--homocysteine methyltransferase
MDNPNTSIGGATGAEGPPDGGARARLRPSFINVGERTNVTGSAKFRKLIEAGSYPDALSVARQQVEAGAQVIDVNMDEGLLDSRAAMVRFLQLIAGEPDIARVPVMIDSSKWEVIEAGLQCVQGKAIVNSISLKAGEAEFLHQARQCLRYGAAAVGHGLRRAGPGRHRGPQGRDLHPRLPAAERTIGFPAEDIIFDPNIFAVATGIEAARQLRRRLHPGGAPDQGRAAARADRRRGVERQLRRSAATSRCGRAMHSVFLFHAIAAGLDMGIVNAGDLPGL